MPKKFPRELKTDVMMATRPGDLAPAEVAADLDISRVAGAPLSGQADIDDGIFDGLTTGEQADIVQLLRARCAASRGRTRSCAARPRSLRQTRSQDDAPRWSVTWPPRGPRGGDRLGVRVHTRGVLPVSGQADLGSGLV